MDVATDFAPALQLATLRPALSGLGSRAVVPQCAWCERIRLGTSWVSTDVLKSRVEVAECPRTHTICASCAADWQRFVVSA
ncbi:MAG: hypothetical protein ACXVZP_00990 [Gaiellaceae bacterium]